MSGHDESRSIGELLGDLGRQVGTLVRRELDLARTEVSSSVGRLSRDAGLVGSGEHWCTPVCSCCWRRRCSA